MSKDYIIRRQALEDRTFPTLELAVREAMNLAEANPLEKYSVYGHEEDFHTESKVIRSKSLREVKQVSPSKYMALDGRIHDKEG